MSPFLSFAALAFRITAGLLLVLASIVLIAPATRERWRGLLPPFTWAFLAAGSVIAGAYLGESLAAATSDDKFVRMIFWHTRAGGPHAWLFWLTRIFVLMPQLLWFPRFRREPLPILLIVLASITPLAIRRLLILVPP
jgi:hypothetical protein